MMKRHTLIFCIFCTVAGKISPTYAKNSGFLGLSIGYYNILENRNTALDLRVEYRPEKSIIFKQLRPWFGLETTYNGTFWGGGGLLWEFNPIEHIFITPSFGTGLYRRAKEDVDLSHPIQFRSQLEIAYAFKNKNRIGLGFSHTSNGGLTNKNRGVETLSLYYYLPL